MEPQSIDDLVDCLALGPEGDPHEVEILRVDPRDSGAVRLVVIRRE
jgi:hypothetical protein